MIRISNNIQELTGEGEEWLLSTDESVVLAKFIDGNIGEGIDRTMIGERTLLYAEMGKGKEVQA